MSTIAETSASAGISTGADVVRSAQQAEAHETLRRQADGLTGRMARTANRGLRAHAQTLDSEQREELKATINEWVGQVFFGTLLREFRTTLNRDNPLNGGRTGAIFTGRLDQELLSRLARSSRFGVADAITESWLGTQ